MTSKNVEIFGRQSDGTATPVLVDSSGNIGVGVALTSADIVTVTGGAGQVADVKVTLDSETVVLTTGTASIGGTKDNGPHWTSVSTYTTSADMQTAADLTAAPTSGQKIVITDIIFSTDTALAMTFQEETSGTVVGKVYAAANSTVQITPRGKWKLPVADKKLQGDASAAGNVAVTVLYYSEA